MGGIWEPSDDERTTDTARTLRSQSSFPERLLGSMLRGRRLEGLKFRRPYPIPPFFADFACAEARLVVELDGESHTGTGKADDARTVCLEKEGWQVLRITVDDLLHHADAVAEAIAQAAREGIVRRSGGGPAA